MNSTHTISTNRTSAPQHTTTPHSPTLAAAQTTDTQPGTGPHTTALAALFQAANKAH